MKHYKTQGKLPRTASRVPQDAARHEVSCPPSTQPHNSTLTGVPHHSGNVHHLPGGHGGRAGEEGGPIRTSFHLAYHEWSQGLSPGGSDCKESAGNAMQETRV